MNDNTTELTRNLMDSFLSAYVPEERGAKHRAFHKALNGLTGVEVTYSEAKELAYKLLYTGADTVARGGLL